MQAVSGACFYTFPTAYALRGTGYFLNGKGYGTGFFTGAAGDAAFLFPMDLYQAESVKPPIDGAQRTQILAERAVNFHGEKQEQQQYPQLPEKQASRLASEHFVGGKKGECAEECAGGVDIFAEGRYLRKSAKQKQGTYTYEEKQGKILSVL